MKKKERRGWKREKHLLKRLNKVNNPKLARKKKVEASLPTPRSSKLSHKNQMKSPKPRKI